MKKTITIILTIASLGLIFDATHTGDKIMMFLFAGIIPGTNSALTPDQRLMFMAISASVVIAWSVVLPLVRKFEAYIAKQNKLALKRLKRASRLSQTA